MIAAGLGVAFVLLSARSGGYLVGTMDRRLNEAERTGAAFMAVLFGLAAYSIWTVL